MRRLFRHSSLHSKLVTAAVLLVAVALLIISLGSAYRFRQYLIDHVDNQLSSAAATADHLQRTESGQLVIPTDWYGRETTPQGIGPDAVYSPKLQPDDLPPLQTGLVKVAELNGHPYTAVAESGRRWRMLVTVLPNGSVLYLAQDLTDLDAQMSRFVLTEVLVGGAALILLGVVAAAMVRIGLRPLVTIERTAEAIAGGDLSRRVPELEPGNPHPQTEMGRLGRALNTMLGQIEAAFTARANSETAALLAESVARDAADQARGSERRARRSEEKMRQFIADASHELRTPLTTIRGFAELYRQGAAREPAQVESLVKRIEDEAARMGLLVEDLLLLARLDEERPLNRTPVELRVLAVDAVSAARAVAPDRDVTLEVAEESGPLLVSADEHRLRQVIGNLMTNALTHTPAGTPVRLRLSAAGADAVLEVKDAGPGLAPEQAERVFERFYRVDSARTRRGGQLNGAASGTGLGLAIVAALVAAHGGRVEVESEPGEGATFRVIIPRDTSEEMSDLVVTSHS